MSLKDDYSEYCLNFKRVWNYLCSCSKPLDDIVSDVCNKRLYFNCEDRWKKLFLETGIAYVTEDTCDYSKLKLDEYKDLGLFSEDGYFLLNERYILPVKDITGNIIALIGWFPDNKKYITTPSRFFSKDCLFFGLEQISETGVNKDYFIVEGIFDSLNIRSLGYNAIAQMGINASSVKVALYGLFKRLVGIPDNDTQGRKVIKNNSWKLPVNASYLKWIGGFGDDKLAIKDIDRLCSLYEEDDIKELLKSCLNSKDNIIKIELS